MRPLVYKAATSAMVTAIAYGGIGVSSLIDHHPALPAPPQARGSQPAPHVTASHPAAPRTAHGTPPSPVASLSPVLAIKFSPGTAATTSTPVQPAAHSTHPAPSSSPAPHPHPVPHPSPSASAPTPAPTATHPSCLISLDALGVAVCASISIGG